MLLEENVHKFLGIYTRCVARFSWKSCKLFVNKLFLFFKEHIAQGGSTCLNLQVHNYITHACIWDNGWCNRWMLLACKEYDNRTHEIVGAYCNYIFSTKVHERTHETWHKESIERKCKEGFSRHVCELRLYAL